LKYAFQIFQNLFVAEAKHKIMLRGEPLVASLVTSLPAFEIVTAAIDFDDQARRMAYEIGNELTHWHLTPKSKSVDMVSF
jgi:hypothetical protein